MPETPQFETWAVVELFGHQVIAGLVGEQTIGGATFVRVDVPEADGAAAFTKFYGPSAIYAITPTDEQTARLAAARMRVKPISLYLLPTPRPTEDDALLRDADNYEDDRDDDDEF